LICAGLIFQRTIVNDNFDPKDPETWPLWLELKEVAQVLRYRDVDSVRALTNKPVSAGGLAYRKEGRRRMVSKLDLHSYMNRPIENATVQVPAPRRFRKPVAPVGRKSFLASIGRAA
jgi:hypothetical protein